MMEQAPLWFKALFVLVVGCLAYGLTWVVQIGWHWLGIVLGATEKTDDEGNPLNH